MKYIYTILIFLIACTTKHTLDIKDNLGNIIYQIDTVNDVFCQAQDTSSIQLHFTSYRSKEEANRSIGKVNIKTDTYKFVNPTINIARTHTYGRDTGHYCFKIDTCTNLDTIPSILIICDTTNINHIVIWVNGYIAKTSYFDKVKYLNEYKKPFPSNYCILLSKSK